MLKSPKTTIVASVSGVGSLTRGSEVFLYGLELFSHWPETYRNDDLIPAKPCVSWGFVVLARGLLKGGRRKQKRKERYHENEEVCKANQDD